MLHFATRVVCLMAQVKYCASIYISGGTCAGLAPAGSSSEALVSLPAMRSVAANGRRPGRRAVVPPPHPAPPDVSQQGQPSEANWTAIDTIDIVDLIVGQGCTTVLDMIPQKPECKQIIGQCQTLVYRACASTDDDICYRGHALEIILSATVLCDARGGANGHRALINRAQAKRFLGGDWVAMWAESRVRDLDDPAVQPIDKQLQRAIIEALDEAEVGKFSDATMLWTGSTVTA